LFLIDSEQFPVSHQPLPVDHRVGDIRRLASINYLRIDTIRIPQETRLIMNRGDVDQDNICPLAGLETPDHVSHVQCFCSNNGCHFQCLTGRQDGRVTGRRFCDQVGQPNFLEHVEVVVGGRTIRADSHVAAKV